MKLCLSIAPASVEEAVALLHSSARTEDIIEVRIDGIDRPDIRRLLQKPRPAVIITNRIRDEGGRFDGNDEEEYRVLSEAIRHGAEFVDVELRWGSGFIKKLQNIKSATRFIVSYHDVEGIPSDISRIYRRARELGADIVKIAFTAASFRDNDVAFDLYERARKDRQKLIAIAMGPYGEVSRILPARSNGFLTYGSSNGKARTAPGQFTADELKNVYRIASLNRGTKLFGLLGNPVSHSKGVYYHNGIFRRKKLNAVYVNFLVDDLQYFFHRYSGQITGASVTMPFKQKVLEYLDTISGPSRELGVVNTIIRNRASLIGSNTDLPAILSILRKNVDLRSRDVIVLGTGATAATMAFAARTLGGKVRIIGRNEEKARLLANRIQTRWASVNDLKELSCNLLMNTIPHPPPSVTGESMIPPVVPDSFFRSGMTVFDAVYEPQSTPLLRSAEASGCRIISGVEFFTAQARLQSRLFLEAAS